ncbi:MAG: hypothetical protein IPN19_00995 [Elusimicrobia bacterium]|nr:hypothetical protein [Elusimicrobiota bacterium]
MESELWSTIRRLAEVEKLSGSAIARRVGVHRQTVKRALLSVTGPPEDLPRRVEGASKLGAYEGYLRERIRAYPELMVQKLFLEIQRQGYAGSYTTVKRYLFPLRRSPKAFLRLETIPGAYSTAN